MARHLLRKQTANTPTPPPIPPSTKLGIHRDSRLITKVQPKIRIIHIFAPEIIHTDVAHFRDLVQRLTGKPSPDHRPTTTPISPSPHPHHHGHHHRPMKLDAGLINCSTSPSSSDDHDDRTAEIWRGHDNHASGGYLTSFNDLDTFDFGEFRMGTADGGPNLNAFVEPPHDRTFL